MANQFFNAAYYLAQNPDVATAGYTLATAEQHYLQYGANENRAPNPYFNATQYLLQYPDLTAGGVTKATALQHYAQYGINEGRQPSTAVIPNDFSYTQYAAANADLRTAFGITDATGATLTVAQQHSLLAHFLSYGYVESRPGVVAVNGDTYFTTLSASVSFAVTGTGTINGSAGNDSFTVASGVTLTTATVNGFAGTDTLTAAALAGANSVTLNSVEKIVINSIADSTLTVLGNAAGTTSLSVNTDALHTFGYTGAKVDALSLLGAGAVTANFSAASVAGTADALALTVGSALTGTLSVNGIETFNVTEGSNSNLNLTANGVAGTTLSVTSTGGVAGAASNINVTALTSAALTTVKVDVSGSASGHTVHVAAGDVDTSITGGSGIDFLFGNSQATIAHTNTLVGGAGVDQLNASAAVDVLTGGAGADVFAFTSGSGAARTVTTGGVTTLAATGVDSVTDFSTGDTLTLAGTLATAGAFGTGATAGIVSAAGVLTFTNNQTNLTDVVNSIDAALNASAAVSGTDLLFKFGADTYLLHTTTAGAAVAGNTLANTDLIKITGVDTANLTLTGTGVAYHA